MMRDELVNCKRCSSNACYKGIVNEEITSYLCMTCGFTTTTLMTGESKTVKDTIKTAPELYKDLKFVDEDGLVWFPANVFVPEIGIVFIDGTSIKDWRWKAARAVLLQEGDVKVSPDQTHKIDMPNAQTFGQLDFMSAWEAAGFLEHAAKNT